MTIVEFIEMLGSGFEDYDDYHDCFYDLTRVEKLGDGDLERIRVEVIDATNKEVIDSFIVEVTRA